MAGGRPNEGRAGNPGNSFGPSTNDLRTARLQRTLQARLADVKPGSESSAVDRLMDDARAHNYSVGEAMQLAKGLQRDLDLAKRAQESADREAVKAFQAANTEEWVRDLVTSVPGVAVAQEGFSAMPSPLHGVRAVALSEHSSVEFH